MRRAFAVLFAIVSLSLVTVPAAADTVASADDDRVGLCAPFEGIAFVFCVALCEARMCDRLDRDDARCGVLRRGFSRTTGEAAPCDGGTLASATSASP
jgi:hypothetical protein